jgi:hypothetical protein
MQCSQRFCHFKCFLEVVFCEGVQHSLRFCLEPLSCAKMAAFQFYQQMGEHGKAGFGGITVMVFIVKISLFKKEV